MANPRDAEFLQRFFKTGPGEYGEGDRFLGIRVPAVRKLLREYCNADVSDAAALLTSPWHEERLFALFLLRREYERSDETTKRKIYALYLRNARFINNWDLVDASAPYIVGAHLHERSRASLYRLLRSRSLWKRRIAVLATFYFIARGEAREALAIAAALLGDREDLLHKATGWMLREVGKRCGVQTLHAFLDRHASAMPRTMLRYAIERLPATTRKLYMKR